MEIKWKPITDNKLKKEAAEEYGKAIKIAINSTPPQLFKDAEKIFSDAYIKVNKTPSGVVNKRLKEISKRIKDGIAAVMLSMNKVSASDIDLFIIEDPVPCAFVVTDINPLMSTGVGAGAIALYDFNRKPISIRIGG